MMLHLVVSMVILALVNGHETTSCDFENKDQPFCMFKEKFYNLHVWKRQKASEANLGPKVDHSKSSEGHYLIVIDQPTTLHLIPNIERDSCLSFWYASSGANIMGYSTDSQYSGISSTTEDKWVQKKYDLKAGVKDMYIVTFFLDGGYFAMDDARLDGQPCDSLGHSGD